MAREESDFGKWPFAVVSGLPRTPCDTSRRVHSAALPHVAPGATGSCCWGLPVPAAGKVACPCTVAAPSPRRVVRAVSLDEATTHAYPFTAYTHQLQALLQLYMYVAALGGCLAACGCARVRVSCRLI